MSQVVDFVYTVSFHIAVIVLLSQYLFAAGCTSLLQPLDVSFNKPFKDVIERLATKHMEDNLDAYVKGELTASIRRVLFTKWVGQAWEEVSANKAMVQRSFRKVGIAVAIDGSEDADIAIEGLKDYAVNEPDSDTSEDPFSDIEDWDESDDVDA